MNNNRPSLDILIFDTYSPYTIGVVDTSYYPSWWNVTSPLLHVVPGGFTPVDIEFTPKNINILNSQTLGITCDGEDNVVIPDGIYTFTYSIYYNPTDGTVESASQTYLRTYQIQQKFDNAFMKLDMMQCDGPIRREQKEILDSVYYFIQGAIAAANNCATDKAVKLYQKANQMLDDFISNQSCYLN